MASGIYQIENTNNGRCYVGSAVHLVNRWATHRRELRRGTHRNRYLQRAWDKHGEPAFCFTVIEEIPDKAQLVPCEQAHIDRGLANGRIYNLAPTAGSALGSIRSPEAKARMSAAQKGRKATPEARLAMSKAQKASNKANPEFLAARIDQLDKARLLVDRDKQRAALGASSRGRVWTAESKAKLSSSCMGRRYSEEIIARMAATKCKPVKCVTLNKVFASASEAASNCGVSISGVSKVCLGKRKAVQGLVFQYVSKGN